MYLLHRFPGAQGIPLSGPRLPAGRNNPVCKGVSALNCTPCRHCWWAGCGDVAPLLCLLLGQRSTITSPRLPWLYQPCLDTCPGLLLELGSYIRKLSPRYSLIMKVSCTGGCPDAWGCCCCALFSFVLGVGGHGVFLPLHCQSPQHPPHSSLSQRFCLLVSQSALSQALGP